MNQDGRWCIQAESPSFREVLGSRFCSSVRFALAHLLISIVIAVLTALLIFGLWYPYPYSQLAHGHELFGLIVSVDVVVGPLLSLVVYSPTKRRKALYRDLGIVFALQLAALSYGVYSLAQARPVLLAFEGDRYWAISVPDIDPVALHANRAAARNIGWTGPNLVGVKLLSGADPEYLKSIQASLNGDHPALRPDRWVDYSEQRQQAIRLARPLAELKRKHPREARLIASSVEESGLSELELGYLPLVTTQRDDWSVVINLKEGTPAFYLPLDAW